MKAHKDDPPREEIEKDWQMSRHSKQSIESQNREIAKLVENLKKLGVPLVCPRILQNQPLVGDATHIDHPDFMKQKFPIYTGKSDPNLHINTIQTQMGWSGCDDVVLCHAFEGTLMVIAQDWYFSLSIGSIANWADLVNKLVKKFENQAEKVTTIEDLVTFQQPR